jgi:hypothetical protein
MNVKITFFNDEPDGFINYVAEKSKLEKILYVLNKHPQLGIS